MNRNLICGICTAVEVASVVYMAHIALKRNKECYEAQMELCDVEFENALLKFDGRAKSREIGKLKREIEELKK